MAKRRAETTGELGARLTIFERKLVELEERVDKVAGDLRNAQSAIDDMRMNDKGLLHEAYNYRTVVEHYRDAGFKALVSAFLRELREERRRIAAAIEMIGEDS